MKNKTRLAIAFFIIFGTAIFWCSTRGSDFNRHGGAREAGAEVIGLRARQPLSFEENRGQTDASVRFLARGPDYGMYFTPHEVIFAFRPGNAGDAQASLLKMKLEGGQALGVTGQGALEGKSHYWRGSDPKAWIREAGHYSKVKYEQLYPGIDLVFYGSRGRVEYDYVVGPGADLGRIAIQIEGAETVRITEAGDLLLKVKGGELLQKAPKVYQEAGGGRQPVSGRYALKGGNRIGFEVAAYDLGRPLVIDPVLVYSTYLGGDDADAGQDIAVDGAGNVYVTGRAASAFSSFPHQASAQSVFSGVSDVFVTKLNPDGGLIYSTYIGGTGRDTGMGIAVDGGGNALVTGYTYSDDFPVTGNALPDTDSQAEYNGDAFLVRLGPSGTLAYSTYLGGSDGDAGYDVAVDGDGNAYLTGYTESADFPRQSSFQAQLGSSIGSDAFIAKFNASGSLEYSSYLGGDGADEGHGVAVDGGGNAYVTGHTSSSFPSFPRRAGAQGSLQGASDVFVTKVDAAGALLYSNYVGGSLLDMGMGIGLNRNNDIYITGVTASTDFPGSVGSRLRGFTDYFVARMTENNGALAVAYSRYLGGDEDDHHDEGGAAIAIDTAGNAYVTGLTRSANFPTVSPLPNGNALGGRKDAFVTKLNMSGTVLFSTYLGGAADADSVFGDLIEFQGDFGHGIAVDRNGVIYVAGFTTSVDFPLHNPLPAGGALSGGKDAFVAKICSVSAPAPSSPPVCQAYQCDAANDRWVLVSLPAATPCSDGNACNGNEACDGAGACIAGTAPNTDDNNPCTTDGCNARTGIYHLSVANGTSCSDGNACTTSDRCFRPNAASVSQCAGTPVNVDDNNPCTADNCNVVTGIISHLARPNGTSCSDGLFCNGAETCRLGSCIRGGAPKPNQCQNGDCNEAADSFPPKPDGTACNDGQSPTGDCCKAGMCLPGDSLSCGSPD